MSAKKEEGAKTVGACTQGEALNSPSPSENDAKRQSIKCPSCGYDFITKTNGKCKLRTRILVFAESGNTMGICPKCKTSLKVPVTLCNRLVVDKQPSTPSGPKQVIPLEPHRTGNY